MIRKYTVYYYMELDGENSFNQTLMTLPYRLDENHLRQAEVKLKKTLGAKKIRILSYKIVEVK